MKAFAVGLLIAVIVIAGQTFLPLEQPAALADPGATGVVQGTVRGDSSTGPVLGGVTVVGGYPGGSVTTTTAADGTYTLNVPISTSSSSSNYVQALVPSGGIYYSTTVPAPNPSPSAPITVDVVLQRNAQVSGLILDSAGAPVSGASVGAYSGGDVVQSTTSGSDGSFHFALFPTAYHFGVSSTGYESRTTPDGTYSAGQIVTLNTITLYHPPVVSGHVTNAEGQPLARISIQSSWAAGTSGGNFSTDANGDFSFVSFSGKSPVVSITDASRNYLPDSVVVGPLAPESHTSLTATLSATGSISGTVTGSGIPLQSFSVTACAAGLSCTGTGSCPYDGYTSYTCVSALTDSAGHYRISGLKSGSYTVVFPAPYAQWYNGSTTQAGATPVTVTAGGTATGISADLKEAKSAVQGQVTLEGTTNSTTYVALYDNSGNLVQKVTSDVFGVFGVNNIPAGTYTLHFQAADGQHLIQWLGNASDLTGATYFTVAPRSTVTNQNITLPLATSFTTSPAPTISGSTTIGSRLTVGTSGWNPQPSNFTYQWYRDGQAIPNATFSSYTVNKIDQSRVITVSVTASKPGYATKTTTSTGVSIPKSLSPTPVPTISGNALVGQTLTANAGTWGPGSVSLTYQWRQNGTPIAGATQKSYVLSTSNAGAKISVAVTGSETGYASVQTISAQTSAVLKVFATIAPPVVSGSAVVGSTLSSTSGTWSSNPATLTFQWFRNGAAIAGATQRNYVPVSADADTKLQVQVTGSTPGYQSASQLSDLTPRILRPFTYVPNPQIMGAATVGTTLVASTPGWGPTPVGLAFQWLSNGVPIPGATGTVYRITSNQFGRKISLVVTGVKSGYHTESRTSVPTATVK